MLKQLLKHKWYIVIIMALIIIEPMLNSTLNFWLQRLFNSAVPGAEKNHILRLLTLGFLLWLLKRIISFYSGVLKNRFICNTKQDVKHRLFINLLNSNTSNIIASASSGEYISLFTNDIVILETRFYNQIISLISNVFSVVILGSSFLALNFKLACAIIVFGIISMFVPIVFSKSLNIKNLAYSNAVSGFTQKVKEYMVAYPTIKNYSIEKIVAEKFHLNNRETEEAKFEADYTLNLANSVGALLSWFMQFIGVGIGLMLVVKGEIMVGTVIAAQSFASDLALPLQNIIMNINSIHSVKKIIEKFEKMSSPGAVSSIGCKTADTTPILKSTDSGCEIVFDNLSLEINKNKIIDNFSFNFKSGKKYLIVGVNGSGKSTLFKTLKRWYRNCSGQIFINGTDITTLSSEEISHNISYLNENVSLFSGTVKENITLFREYNNKTFRQATKSVQIHLDLEREISGEGYNISSGEQRRIEIARSLLESVNVLIFDEVVSTLDIETAYDIEKLALSFKNKTVIFVSHNFSGKLIHKYDEILVMNNGKLIANGEYRELLEKCEYFRKICEIKFGEQLLNL